MSGKIDPETGRKRGSSRLVYDKEKRKIVTVRTPYETELTIAELCEGLGGAASLLKHAPGNRAVVMEAAARLSRFAPVKIDPEDEGTWPTESDADDSGLMAKPCVEVWYPESERWYPIYFELVGSRALKPGYTHWRRINTEPPEDQ